MKTFRRMSSYSKAIKKYRAFYTPMALVVIKRKNR